MSDTSSRSVAKAISWRATGSFSTFVISYLLTENFTVASSIAVVQITANTILYFVHERIWNKIKWGRVSQF